MSFIGNKRTFSHSVNKADSVAKNLITKMAGTLIITQHQQLKIPLNIKL